jgi:sulfite exporter TauE/SafE
MLSSIHPLGERSRDNKWVVTVLAFTVGSIASGSAVGAVFGWIGYMIVGRVEETALLAATAGVALAAGTLDLAKARPPGPRRQVNETWIGAFRGWVYGGGFGLELGAGMATYVVTWSVYAMFVGEFLTSSATAGALIGAVFGLGRSLSLMTAGCVDRPSRLTSFNRKLVTVGPVVRRSGASLLVAAGVVVIATGIT